MKFAEENEISEKSQGGTEITKRSIAQFVDQETVKEFQIIPSRLRKLEEDKIRIYWQHDLPEDGEVNHLATEESRARFHKFVFSSNWQQQEFVNKLKMPCDEKMAVIETPIRPIEVQPKNFDQINLVYFSTPQRGLGLLVPVFEELAKHHKNIHLHVFSSFKIYGWDDPDVFKELFKHIDNHPQMTYHGSVDQDRLREFLSKEAHILAYPSVWKETSCRVLIESMSAELMCVHPNFGALPDTAGGMTTMYQYFEDHNKHMHTLYKHLEHAIAVVDSEGARNFLRFVKLYADTRFDLKKISDMWNILMKDLLMAYPTPESRKIAQPVKYFHYKGL